MAVRQGPNHISTQRNRIAQLAKRNPGRVLTSLHHFIDLQWMYEAYILTRKDGAVGIDGVTAKEYHENLHENLQNLLERFKSGRYRAPLIRRVHIPKGEKTRPIGITTFEDKILQRAVAMVLEQVYEQEFYDFSYGFRPGRSPHMALKAVWGGHWKKYGYWALEVDVKGYFDNINHKHLRKFLDQRVRDGVLRRMIDKWLKAGITEEGQVTYSDVGTPQGGVISPLISNIFLHHVLDKWFVEDVQPRMVGRAQIVRYADDFLIILSRENDARRVLDVLYERFSKYGLEIHPEKTRLVRMYPPTSRKGKKPRDVKRETLEFLGFTLYWGKLRNGNWAVKPKTSKGRLKRCLKAISAWCRRHMHRKIKDQSEELAKKLKGHYQYYGVSFNSRSMANFRFKVIRIWQYWLSRRSGRKHLNWESFSRKTERHPLPYPRITKPLF